MTIKYRRIADILWSYYKILVTDPLTINIAQESLDNMVTEPPRVSRRPNFLREYPNEKYLLT